MLILPPALSNTNKFSRDETTCVASLISMGENVDDSIPPPPSLFSSSTTVAQKSRQARLEREMSPSPMSVSSSENSLLELSIPSPALRSSSTTVLKKRAYSDGSENQSHVSEYSNNCTPPQLSDHLLSQTSSSKSKIFLKITMIASALYLYPACCDRFQVQQFFVFWKRWKKTPSLVYQVYRLIVQNILRVNTVALLRLQKIPHIPNQNLR